MSQIISTDLRHSVYRRDGWACVYCGSTELLSIDHVVPQAAGGSNHYSNLVTCCLPCNCSKGDSPVRTWLRRVLETEQDVTWVMAQVRNSRRRVLRRGLETVLMSCSILGRAVPRSYLAARALLAEPKALAA